MTKAQENLRRILQGLRLLAHKHRGHIRRLETGKLEKYPGFLSRIHGGRLPSVFSGLNETLEALDEGIEGFFGLHLGFTPEPILLLETLDPRDRRRRLPTELAVPLARLLAGEPAEPAAEEPASELPAKHRDLDQLEALRYRDVETAARLAIDTANEIAARLAKPPGWRAAYCRALGIVGSACRQLGHRGAANRTLRKALTHARRWNLLAEEARLTQRSAYLLNEYGEPGLALELARHAGILYAQVPDLVGVAKAMIDEGLMLNQLDRAAEAAEIFETTLPLLPASESRDRAAAHCGLARRHQELGELEAAAKALETAAALLDTAETRNLANVTTRRGEIASAQGRPEQAEQFFREARRLSG